ncbi:MAG: hypothetical protein J0L76_06730 [Rhodobacterales bacterium]|nr:hypothetical protein [Rhodobacterales bacterium]
MSCQVLNRDLPAYDRPVGDCGLGHSARLFRLYLIVGCIAPPILTWQVHAKGDPDFPAWITVYLGLVAFWPAGHRCLDERSPRRAAQPFLCSTALWFLLASLTLPPL